MREDNWGTESLTSREIHLVNYVDPELVWVEAQNEIGKNQEKEFDILDKEKLVPRDKQPVFVFKEIRKSEKNLVISVGAGSGKTILTRRLASLISKHNFKPPLMVFRFYKKNLPNAPFKCLRELLLADKTLNILFKDEILKESLIDTSLDNRRVVVIIDGFDELESETQKTFIRMIDCAGDEYASNPAKITTIITGRQHTIDQYSQVLKSDSFRQINIKPFSLELQDEYFDGPKGSRPDRKRNPLVGSKFKQKKWRDVLPDDNSLEEILGLPHTLNQIRIAIEQNVKDKSRNELIQFVSQSDLFLYASDRLLDFALHPDKTGFELRKKNPVKLLLEQILAIVAWEMTCEGHYGSVSGEPGYKSNKIEDIKNQCSARFQNLGMGSVEDFIHGWDLLSKIELNHRGYYEDWNDDCISFRNWRMQELHVARFLTHYATKVEIDRSDYSQSLIDFTGNSNWLRILTLAGEMPLMTKSPDNPSSHAQNQRKFLLGARIENYYLTLKSIFSPEAINSTTLTARRPTEAMYKSIKFLESQYETEHVEFRKNLAKELKYDLAEEFQAIKHGTATWIDENLRKEFQLIAEGIFHKKDDVGKEINPDKSLFVFLPDPANPGDGKDIGQFTMGSPQEEKVKVHLSPFAMHRFQVRNKEFQLFDAGQADSLREKKELNGPDQPAVSVDWYDAVVYTWFLQKQQVNGKDWEIVLPTEAQWEYTCRAGSTTEFCFGDEESDLEKYAWYLGNPKTNDQTHPVGQLQPNAWGLYDMHGNAWEWCADWYAVELTGGNDPTGPAVGSFRVLRGGSWDDVAAICRSAFRSGYFPGFRSENGGFRVALRPSGIPR